MVSSLRSPAASTASQSALRAAADFPARWMREASSTMLGNDKLPDDPANSDAAGTSQRASAGRSLTPIADGGIYAVVKTRGRVIQSGETDACEMPPALRGSHSKRPHATSGTQTMNGGPEKAHAMRRRSGFKISCAPIASGTECRSRAAGAATGGEVLLQCLSPGQAFVVRRLSRRTTRSRSQFLTVSSRKKRPSGF